MGDQQNQNKQTNQAGSQEDQVIRNYKYHIDRNLCIGAASCVAVAPKAYTLDSEAKAVFLTTAEEETDQTLLDAAKACPVAAIIITDTNTGKQIFP